MIRSIFRMSALLILVGTLVLPATAQDFPRPDKSPVDIAMYRVDKEPRIKVVYSRPAKNNRKVFGELVPYGEVWRTGANEATEIRLYAPATIGDQQIEAGIYSLFSIPGQDTWTIIFSRQTDVWGAYQYDASKDVIRVEVPAYEEDSAVEFFAIAFKEVEKKAHMVLAWDKTRVAVPVSF